MNSIKVEEVELEDLAGKGPIHTLEIIENCCSSTILELIDRLGGESKFSDCSCLAGDKQETIAPEGMHGVHFVKLPPETLRKVQIFGEKAFENFDVADNEGNILFSSYGRLWIADMLTEDRCLVKVGGPAGVFYSIKKLPETEELSMLENIKKKLYKIKRTRKRTV